MCFKCVRVFVKCMGLKNSLAVLFFITNSTRTQEKQDVLERTLNVITERTEMCKDGEQECVKGKNINDLEQQKY